ncbi:sulfurtransferase TusA family protein [Kingella sp. (in: b-proteobacteria)]|uniref:sulfurtransferase TusA family protein n=1 Tax=Kingella sp. (in: b-proteobacteria) TaxID=2020713 RepID=UPI0026DD45FB|nr:sulfurtransferase TusA family protein [Kingella sp. (in: b-proteobacteria)]MDO4656354.1 sulfurtransferase TusA family protein [Kingella sp. (in: b-proteobacteria)]
MPTLDLTGLKCPLPILRAKKALATLDSGAIITILATDAGAPADFAAFCQHTGHELLDSREENGVFTLVLKRK